MPQFLDAGDSRQVHSPTVLDVPVAMTGPNNRPLRMLILSGIARTGFDSQGNLDRRQVAVRLGAFQTEDRNYQVSGQTPAVGTAGVATRRRSHPPRGGRRCLTAAGLPA